MFEFREPFTNLVHSVLGIADFPPTERYGGFFKPKVRSSHKKSKSTKTPESADGYMTSYGLHHLYNITHPVDMTSTQAPAEFLNDNCVSQTDLNLFTKAQDLPNITLNESM